MSIGYDNGFSDCNSVFWTLESMLVIKIIEVEEVIAANGLAT